MAQKPAQKPRQSDTMTPDSLPKRNENLPGSPRRGEEQFRDTPDSLPPQDDLPLTGSAGISSDTADGGRFDHPTHDEAPDDMKPEDFERQMDEARQGKLELRTEDESIDPRATHTFARGSSDPLHDKERGARVSKP